MVVEDDFTARLLSQRFLSRYGECDVAVNGREAVDAFQAASNDGGAYDLVCMDIQMPEMDGRAAVRHIRRFEQMRAGSSTCRAKVVMTTGVDDAEEVVRLQGLVDAYLLKPVDLQKLMGRLKALSLL